MGNLVLDNTEAFASNYPRPEFFFKHAQGHQMRIDKMGVVLNCGQIPLIKSKYMN